MKTQLITCLFLLTSCISPSMTIANGSLPSAEGATLDYVAVGPELGDGRFTEADLYALSDYSLWGWSSLLSMQGHGTSFDEESRRRMADFWAYVWPHLDHESKAIYSNSDRLWPAIQNSLHSQPSAQAVYLQQFYSVFQTMWTGIEYQTLQYLLGDLDPGSFAAIVDTRIWSQQQYSSGSVSGYTDDLGNWAVGRDGSILSEADIGSIGDVGGSWSWD